MQKVGAGTQQVDAAGRTMQESVASNEQVAALMSRSTSNQYPINSITEVSPIPMTATMRASPTWCRPR